MIKWLKSLFNKKQTINKVVKEIKDFSIYTQLNYFTPEELKHILKVLNDFKESYKYYMEHLYNEQKSSITSAYETKKQALNHYLNKDKITKDFYELELDKTEEMYHKGIQRIEENRDKFEEDNNFNKIILNKFSKHFQDIL